MKEIVLGADHAGFELKEKIKQHLKEQGWNVDDRNPVFQAGDDFPLVGKEIARIVTSHPNTEGIAVCGSGGGMTIAVNRISGARGVCVRSLEEIVWAREDDSSNILVLASRLISTEEALRITDAWLAHPTSGIERFVRRAKLLDQA